MKTTKILSLVTVVSLLLSNCSESNEEVLEKQLTLIAQYPLASDGLDATGNNGPMNLINSPFQNGGVYCNGVYEYSDGDYCVVVTPSLNSFNPQSFSISADFQVSEKITQPVWIIGTSCRWLGFYLRDGGSVALLYNNWDFLETDKGYTLNEWHNAEISFDGTTVKIFLDGDLAGSLKFGNGYVPLNYSTCGEDDTQIGVTNYSNGEVLKGFIKNVTVYSSK